MYGILQQSAFAETKKEVLLMFGSYMSKTSEKYAQINLYIPHDGSKRPLQIAQQPGKAVTAIKPSTCPAPRLSSTLSPGMSKGGWGSSTPPKHFVDFDGFMVSCHPSREYSTPMSSAKWIQNWAWLPNPLLSPHIYWIQIWKHLKFLGSSCTK